MPRRSPKLTGRCPVAGSAHNVYSIIPSMVGRHIVRADGAGRVDAQPRGPHAEHAPVPQRTRRCLVLFAWHFLGAGSLSRTSEGFPARALWQGGAARVDRAGRASSLLGGRHSAPAPVLQEPGAAGGPATGCRRCVYSPRRHCCWARIGFASNPSFTRHLVANIAIAFKAIAVVIAKHALAAPCRPYCLATRSLPSRRYACKASY